MTRFRRGRTVMIECFDANKHCVFKGLRFIESDEIGVPVGEDVARVVVTDMGPSVIPLNFDSGKLESE